jgi:hypothetical protein
MTERRHVEHICDARIVERELDVRAPFDEVCPTVSVPRSQLVNSTPQRQRQLAR